MSVAQGKRPVRPAIPTVPNQRLITVVREDKTKVHVGGKRYWFCKCVCGETPSVLGSSISSGNTRSCGCLVKHAARKLLPKKHEVRAAYKRFEVIVIDGKRYLSMRKAVAVMRPAVSETTLYNWANLSEEKRGCPWLGGEAIITKLVRSAFNREVNYFLEDDLDRANAARSRLVRAPAHPGKMQVSQAANELGVSPDTLRILQLSDGAKSTNHLARSRDGRAVNRAYIETTFVDRAKATRQGNPVPPGWVTVEVAAKELGCARVTIHKYARNMKLASKLGQKIVAASRAKGGPKLRYRMKARLISQESIDRLKASQEGRTLPAQATTSPVASVLPAPGVAYAELVSHGNRCYSLDGVNMVTVTMSEDNVLQAFLEAGTALDKPDLEDKSGVSNAPLTVGKIAKRFPDAVRTPKGRKNSGGYWIRVRPADCESFKPIPK